MGGDATRSRGGHEIGFNRELASRTTAHLLKKLEKLVDVAIEAVESEKIAKPRSKRRRTAPAVPCPPCTSPRREELLHLLERIVIQDRGSVVRRDRALPNLAVMKPKGPRAVCGGDQPITGDAINAVDLKLGCTVVVFETPKTRKIGGTVKVDRRSREEIQPFTAHDDISAS